MIKLKNCILPLDQLQAFWNLAKNFNSDFHSQNIIMECKISETWEKWTDVSHYQTETKYYSYFYY